MVALLAVLVATAGGCALVNRVRAKNALNEGARAYRDGRFADAEEKFRYSYDLDPSQKNAPLFIARAVQQQYKPGVQSPENLAIGERAVAAYQDIFQKDPNNDDALKAIVFIYTQMKQDDKVKQLLIERASNAPSPEKRAEALVILASKQWQCAYDITEQKENTDQRREGWQGSHPRIRAPDQAAFDQGEPVRDRGTEARRASRFARRYQSQCLVTESEPASREGEARRDGRQRTGEGRLRQAV